VISRSHKHQNGEVSVNQTFYWPQQFTVYFYEKCFTLINITVTKYKFYQNKNLPYEKIINRTEIVKTKLLNSVMQTLQNLPLNV
jgi:hypothetical protein